MRKNSLFIFFIFLHARLFSISDDKIERFSEYAGVCIGEGFQYMKGCYNIDAVIRGLKNCDNGKCVNSDLSEEDLQVILDVQTELFNKVASDNLLKAETFLKELAKNPEIVTLTDKLFYERLQEGTGNNILIENSTALLNYSAQLIDGTEIVNTFKNNEPIEIHLPEVVVGFVNGTRGMKEGERRKIYIHPDLAYKKTGNLPPNSLLILECEFVKLTR